MTELINTMNMGILEFTSVMDVICDIGYIGIHLFGVGLLVYLIVKGCKALARKIFKR